MGSSTRATILDDKEAMKEIAEYVIKEIERRDRIEKRKLNKIQVVTKIMVIMIKGECIDG